MSVEAVFAQDNLDTNAVVYGWNLDQSFLNPEKATIDTNLVDFQLNNIVLRKYISATYLGGNGSVYIPNSFFDREFAYEELLFLPGYMDYFYDYHNTRYLNTRKPFTYLEYINGGSRATKEEGITVKHSQNVTNKFNFGFKFRVLSNKGQYSYQNINSKNFNAHTSYSGEKYKLHASFNVNRYKGEENGGLNDSIFRGTEEEPRDYQTNFKGEETSPYKAFTTNKIRYYDGMISQRYKLFSIGNSKDSLGGNTMAEPIISHVFTIRRVSKMYEENLEGNLPDTPIYRNYFSNINETYDSVSEFMVTNKLQLDFKTRLRGKVMVGLWGSINHEHLKYNYYTLLDSSLISSTVAEPKEGSRVYSYYIDGIDTINDINRNKDISNLFIAGGIYGKFWTHIEGNFTAKVYFAGYKAGQTQLKGNIITNAMILNRPFSWFVEGQLENIVPSYHFNNYYTNNYIWQQKLKSVNKITLSSKLSAPSNNFELSGNYALISNHLYMTDSLPKTYDQPLNILSVGISKGFVLWKFNTFSKLIYQVSENRDIVEVPGIILFNSAYFDHTWEFSLTGGKLRTMLGVDLRYSTAFNGYDYLPSASVFYQSENKTSVGNYPFVDIWLNVLLKRTRFFAKMVHFNSSWGRKDFYTAVNYPAYQQYFKFGISWIFYN